MSNNTIIIENKNTAGGPAKFYNVYAEQPEISGTSGLQTTYPVVWYKSLAIPRGGRDTFRCTPTFHAFVGRSSQFSSEVKPGDAISVVNSLPATIGLKQARGSQFLLDTNFGINEDGTSAGTGTFSLGTDSGFGEPNDYVVGVAREQVGGQLTPIAVVDLKAAVDYVFKPKRTIFVTTTQIERGEVLEPPKESSQFAKVEFKDARKTAIVSETAGKFTVTYV